VKYFILYIKENIFQMGILVDKIGLRLLVHGDGVVDNFKNNSEFFVQKYRKSDADVRAIDVRNIYPGGFYHFHYLDDSNWMRWSPVFVINYKILSGQTIVFAVNFNFIPLEVRAYLFDKFIQEDDFEKNRLLKVDYEGVYRELRKFGFEYALVEYNAAQIKLVHKISMNMVPRFLISGHPENKYDPKKLFQIWKVKLKDKDKRNKEIMSATMDEFYDAKGEISEKYIVLKNHIQRIQANQKKYGS
jgi:hypothetical protein